MAKEEMNCMFCEGNVELKHETIKLLGGKVILKDQPYYRCRKCRKEFVSSEQMGQTEKEVNTFSISRLIVSTGRSLAITLPKDIAEFYGLKKGEKVHLIPESKHVLKVRV